MFEPINARLASSCSRNGIRPAETPTICFGEMSMYWTCSTGIVWKSVWYRAMTLSALELAVLVGRRVGRGEVGLALLVGPQPDDLVGQLAVLDLAVGRDQEAVLVDPGVDRPASEIRPMFVPSGRLDRADAAVVRDVHVADFEARPACGSSRPGPRADSRRSCVSCASGFVWSTTCDSSPRPKKYSIAARDALGVDQRPRASCPRRPSGSSAPARCGGA